MPFQHTRDLKYFFSDNLNDLAVVHAIFTRHGGVSQPPVDSLNIGGTVGDRPEAVRQNLERVFESVQRPVGSLYDVWQIHSSRVVVADAPRREQPIIQADGIITRSTDVTLLMRFADCVPILGYDPARRAIGIAHAGWKGTLDKTGPAMVEAMSSHFGSRPKDIRIVLGPSIGPDHYEIGQDVISGVMDVFEGQAEAVLQHRNGQTSLDLWTANRLLLEGVGVEDIEIAGICTACHPDDWFSHRAEKGRTGRFGALIALRDEDDDA
jgi:YfiH family protein